jgi:hypothetical protein
MILQLSSLEKKRIDMLVRSMVTLKKGVQLWKGGSRRLASCGMGIACSIDEIRNMIVKSGG